jgi:hypothetical protein
VGLSVFSAVRYEGSVHVTSVSVKRARPRGEAELFLYDAAVVTDRPARGRPATVSFRLSRPYRNPFERGLVSVSLRKSGREVFRVPAYFFQDYRRAREGALMPVREPAWRAHLVAPKVGRYTWVVYAKDGSEVVELDGGELAALEPVERVAAGEPPAADRLSRFTLPRRVPRKAPVFHLSGARWTLVHEGSDEPVVRAWHVPLEWTERWGRFHGLGRYNLEAAWAFDRLLAEAESAGVRLPLALNADRAFGGHGTYNWFSNPLARHMGGPLGAPSEYFTNEQAERYFRRRAAYAAARWGSSPAVSRFELWMSMPANFAEAWHDRAAAFFRRAPLFGKAVVSRHPQGAVLGKRRRVAGFEQQWSAWRPERRISPSTRIAPVKTPSVGGHGSLQTTAGFPGEAAIYSDVKTNWNGYARLTFDVYVPEGAPNDMRAMVYCRERDWWWYETLLDPLLRPGDWTKLIVDISPDSAIWTARGHKRAWDGYVAQNIRRMGIRIFGHRKYAGPVYIDNIELWPDPEHPRPVRVHDLTLNRDRVGQYEKLEVTFRIDRVFVNPFDPAEADVRGHFISPAGKHVEVPAFFFQGYARHLEGGRERLSPVGGACWKVRFAAADTGRWTGYLKVNGKPRTARDAIRFEVVGSDHPGYVRRSLRDPSYLEFTGGRFFYPIGHNLRSPSDGRRPYPYKFETPEGKGTYIYDDYFARMAKAGENMARVWMCSWWCGLEWNEKWHGYGGIGRYNMENAWRLDHLVGEAARRGIYIALDTTNHGQYSVEIDREWQDNPYNVLNGGFLEKASDFFTSAKARRLTENRLRYTIARWGHSPSILMWTLFSEVEFVQAYWNRSKHNARWGSPDVVAWHARMARFIRAVDPFGHIVTTHVSHPWRGHDIWSRPELDIIQSNAYSKYPELGQVDVVATLKKIYHDKLKQFHRPVFIAEYGGHWMRNAPRTLDAELHCGLWATAMMPYAGNTGFWWWLHVHFADKYQHYRALANFMAGEDRRGLDLAQGNYLVNSPGDVLQAVGLQNDTRADVWVYHRRAPTTLKGLRPVRKASLGLTGLEDGVYRVEFWDTYKGARTSQIKVKTNDSRILIDLPVLKNDVALKVRLEKRARTSPPEK